MELQEMIKDLINSKILENEELALTLLRSDEISQEEKRKAIDIYVKDYIAGKIKIDDKEKDNIFRMWTKIYLKTLDDEVKKRIIKI
jgi:hypothetical protein